MERSLGALMAVPNACLLAWGWRRRGLAFAAGGVSAFALPPFGWFPLLFVTFPALVWLLDGAIETGTRQSALRRIASGFSIGWWFGFGYFLAGLWWIGSAFLVEADRFAWMMPFAVLAMPVGLALFTAAGTAFSALFWTDRWSRVLALALFLSLADWVRGHVLTGFPWNLFGYAFSKPLVLAQSASLIGIYGLSFLAVLIFALPAVVADHKPLRVRLAGLTASLALLAGMAVFGLVRLDLVEDPGFSDVDVRVVQPSIAQTEKWVPENKDWIFDTYLDLTHKPLGGTARVGHERLIIWPESAVPFLLTHEPGALYRISQALPPQTTLITGAIRFERSSDGPAYYNSVYLIDADGEVQDVYDKVHLVPFGEYLPLRSLLQRLGLEQLVDVPGTFHAGLRHRVMVPQTAPSFLPLVCYEAIFPDFAGASDVRPGFLLNVTNDAWFGDTTGPYQHFAQARMRAIEQGLPLVRAANTGISAVIDAKGRVHDALPLLTRGVIDSRLPERLPMTIYAGYGDVIFSVFSILSFVLLSKHRYNPGSRKN